MTTDPAATAVGYLTIPLLDASTIARLRARFDQIGLPPDHGFHATSADGPRDTARAVDQYLKAELTPLIAPVLPGYEPFLAAFISKGAGGGVAVDFHQDWTYTDERAARAVILWIPLVDTDAANGSLHAVPGSHRWATGLRASGGTHATSPLQQQFAAAATDVPLDAGTAFVYDPALVHGSGPNPTTAPRPAAAIALAPRDAQLVHFHLDPDDTLTGWAIDESHYTTRPFGSRPEGCAPIEPWDRLVTTADLGRHLVP